MAPSRAPPSESDRRPDPAVHARGIPLNSTDLLVALDAAIAENAPAFAVVEIDDSGSPFRVVGPFGQAEQALVAGEEEVARWVRERSCEEDGEITYAVVPLWGPGE